LSDQRRFPLLGRPYRLDSGSEFCFFFLDHQFEEISHRSGILSDLDLGIWIHDGKTYQ
jgi:hypothetical protein